MAKVIDFTAKLFLVVALFSLQSCSENKTTLNIAVASNFEKTLNKIIAQYPNSDYKINVIAASSGVLTNQILNNAPFDLFLSADSEKPQLLFNKLKLNKPATIYANGLLSLWIPNSPKGNCLTQLSHIKTLAMANPKTAPYGKLAKKILGKQNSEIEKIIQTANALQAYIYTKDGLTQAGFVPFSLVKGETSGCIQVFEQQPISQSMILLKDKAQDIVNFINSAPIKKLIRTEGYLVN